MRVVHSKDRTDISAMRLSPLTASCASPEPSVILWGGGAQPLQVLRPVQLEPSVSLDPKTLSNYLMQPGHWLVLDGRDPGQPLELGRGGSLGQR